MVGYCVGVVDVSRLCMVSCQVEMEDSCLMMLLMVDHIVKVTDDERMVGA